MSTGNILLGQKPPIKADKNRSKQKSKQNGKERTDNKKHRHTYKNTTMQCIIYSIKQTKTIKNKAGKTNDTKVTQLLAPGTRKYKKLLPKTRKKNKRTSPNPKQETKQ